MSELGLMGVGVVVREKRKQPGPRLASLYWAL